MALKPEDNQSWFEVMKEKFDFERIKTYVAHLSIAHLVFYFGSGFLSGFLCKKFGKYFFFTLVVGSIAIYLLQYAHVISLDMDRLRSLLGLTQEDSIDAIIRHYFDWISNNLIYSILTAIGFIIGYKIG